MRRLIVVLALLGATLTLGACIIEEPGPGPRHERWCYYHPYRC